MTSNTIGLCQQAKDKGKDNIWNEEKIDILYKIIALPYYSFLFRIVLLNVLKGGALTFDLYISLSSLQALVHSSLVNFFHVSENRYMPFKVLKEALLACKRCPFEVLLTPF